MEKKNGKAIMTRSIEKINKNYLKEKSNPYYGKDNEEIKNQNDKRKIKGNYYNIYLNKKPKRSFQKCIEFSSDFQPSYNEKENININNILENNEKKNIMHRNNENKNQQTLIYIKNNFEMTDEQQKKMNLLKEKSINNLKNMKTNIYIIKNESIQNIGNFEDNNNTICSEIHLNQDLIKKKELQKKYFKDFIRNIKRYTRNIENNIKRENSKNSEKSDDKPPETIKKKKRNNIPINSNTVHKKKIISHNNFQTINRNLKIHMKNRKIM